MGVGESSDIEVVKRIRWYGGKESYFL